MKNTGRLLFLLTCVLSSACALRSPVLRIPDGKVYGEASVGADVSTGLVISKAGDKPKTFNDPNYGNVVVASSKRECSQYAPHCPSVPYMVQADTRYSIGTDRIRLETGIAAVWLSKYSYNLLTGYNADPWDRWYYTNLDPKRFADPFVGLGIGLGSKSKKGRGHNFQLLAGVGFPRAHFDWTRQVCDQDRTGNPIVHIPSNSTWSFTCGAESRQGGDARGTSLRVRFAWKNNDGGWATDVVGVEYIGYFFNPVIAGERMRYQMHTLNLVLQP